MKIFFILSYFLLTPTTTYSQNCGAGYTWNGAFCIDSSGCGVGYQAQGAGDYVMCVPIPTNSSDFGEISESRGDDLFSGAAHSNSGSKDIGTKGQKPGSSDAACEDAQEKTKKACTGASWVEKNSGVISMISNLTNTATSMSNANSKSACEASKKLNGLMTAANATVVAMCAMSTRSCKKVCTEPGTLAACDRLGNSSKSVMEQAVGTALNFASAGAVCDTIAADSCSGDDAYNNENCQQFCLKPGRQNHPKCQLALSSCSNTSYAAQNVQYCTCVNNPFSPACSTANNALPTSNNTALNLDDSGSSDYDFDGATGGGTPASVNTPSGGGGGGGGFGGGSAAFGADEGGGGGAEPLNKDILTGVGGGGGAAGIFGGSGGGYAEGGGSGNKGSGGGAGNDGALDLRAFLPGGKKDPTRNPASAGYADPSITKANGLSNWQKVTRKLNEKRPELLP